MCIWNKYVNVLLEDCIFYNEIGDMWGINKLNFLEFLVKVFYKESGYMIWGNNVEILILVENVVFVYWVIGEEKFVCFVIDIFNVWLVGMYYMNFILDFEKLCGSVGGWELGGICGYYDYEQIYDDLVMYVVMVYDFVFDYLIWYFYVYLKVIGKDIKMVVVEVFKCFINIGLVCGGKLGNWNVNGWNIMLCFMLVFDYNEVYVDGKGKEYYLNLLVNEFIFYYDVIFDILKIYDWVIGLWLEFFGYLFGIVQLLFDWVVFLKCVGIDIIVGNFILQKVVMVVFFWMDDVVNMVVFGDLCGGSVNFQMFENLLIYYIGIDNKEGVEKVVSVLNKGIF